MAVIFLDKAKKENRNIFCLFLEKIGWLFCDDGGYKFHTYKLYWYLKTRWITKKTKIF